MVKEWYKLMNNNFNLDKLIDLEKWEDLQETIASVTNVAIIIVDYKGIQLPSIADVIDFVRK